MKFKEKFGDYTNKEYKTNLVVEKMYLDSLEGCPEIIKGDFNCSNNNLTSLKHISSTIYGAVNCSKNKLTSLKGIQK